MPSSPRSARAEIARHGVVLERNLAELRTHSVGVLQVGGLRTSYFGTQRTTLNRHGHEVYGGSSLTVARGGLDVLERLTTDARRPSRDRAGGCLPRGCPRVVRRHVRVALQLRHRRRPRRQAGQAHSGVLEQSWRLGGASGAEVAALEAFRSDPSRTTVRTSTTELHRADAALPDGATLYYSGVDPHLGPIVKYAEVHADDRA